MIHTLQAMRAAAAILILIHHCGFQCPAAVSFGDLGVAFFMILSGLVQGISFDRRTAAAYRISPADIGRFMARKLAFIYPLYLITFIAAIALKDFDITPSTALLDLAMLQSWIPDGAVYFSANGVAWFISDIMVCYLLFLPMASAAKRHPAACMAGWAIYFAAYFTVLRIIPPSSFNNLIYINPLMQLSSFIVGMMLWQLTRHRAWPRKIKPVAATAAFIIAMMLMAAAIYCYPHVTPRLTLCSYWWIPCGLLILSGVALDSSVSLPGRLMRTPFLQKLGNASLSFYLIHYPLLKGIERVAGTYGFTLTPVQLLGTALIILIPLSIAVQTYVVIPLGRRLTGQV